LDEVIARARAGAEVSPENPDHPGLAEPAKYPVVQSFDEETAEFTPQERAEGVGAVCKLAEEKGANAFGAFSTSTGEVVIANTAGLFAYHAGTMFDFQTVVMDREGPASGWAQHSGWRVGDIDTVELGHEAVQKTEMGRDPQDLEPGDYTVILDPYAVVDITQGLSIYGGSGLSVEEGRSWMNNRIGETVMSPLVTLRDDALDQDGIPLPFDFEGMPKRPFELIKEGKVISPTHDRSSAKKAGVKSTGHGLPPDGRHMGGIPFNLFLEPGDKTVEEMIRSTERGLYITRFHYTRLVHPTDCIVTGMTRDGTYLVENGEIVHPVKSLRWTQSYVDALAAVEAVGSQTVLMMQFFGMSARMPALKVKNWTFTGATG
jgi:predicted Zn-dependent protease